MFQTNASAFRRLAAGTRILGPVVGRGLLTSEGEAWRRQRKAMAPAFTPRTVPVLAEHVARCAQDAIGDLEARGDGAAVDLLAAMQSLALEIAGTTMFSMQTAAFNDALRAAITGYMTTIGKPRPSDFFLPAGWPTPLSLARRRFRRRWLALIGDVVARRRALGPPAEPPRDLYDMMAAAHGDADPDLLVDEVATMIVAGHETTALVLFWSCLLLAQAPDWQDGVAEEARAHDLTPTGAAASLPYLKRTRAVVNEALRLYPPAFMSARECVSPQRICGVDVPKGAIVLIPFFLLHRDPRHWDRPEAFDPGRFLDGSEPERYAFLPFGIGPNACIGAQLAMTEAVLVLARLLAGGRLALAEPDAPPTLPIGVLSTRPDRAPGVLLHRR